MAFCSLKDVEYPPVKSRTPVIETLLGCGPRAALRVEPEPGALLPTNYHVARADRRPLAAEEVATLLKEQVAVLVYPEQDEVDPLFLRIVKSQTLLLAENTPWELLNTEYSPEPALAKVDERGVLQLRRVGTINRRSVVTREKLGEPNPVRSPKFAMTTTTRFEVVQQIALAAAEARDHVGKRPCKNSCVS